MELSPKAPDRKKIPEKRKMGGGREGAVRDSDYPSLNRSQGFKEA